MLILIIVGYSSPGLNNKLQVSCSGHGLNSQHKVHYSSHQSFNLSIGMKNKLLVLYSGHGLNNGAFNDQTTFNYSNIGQVRNSGPHRTHSS